MDERHGLKRRLTDENELEVPGCSTSPQQIEVLTPELFKDDSLSVGGQLKAKGEVLKELFFGVIFRKGTGIVCGVDALTRICKTFDVRQKMWVEEMGFGGLLNIPEDMILPRKFAYWLMTRIDPLNKILISPDGKHHKLSSNEIHWVFGIPNGGEEIPTYESLNEEMLEKVRKIRESYGRRNKSKGSGGLVYKSKPTGISLSKEMIDKIEGEWEEDQQDEFKTLFLLFALNKLLCPTSPNTLAGDLVPALTCAANAAEYDWCSLVLEKLMESVATFARQFYSFGFTRSCTGCLIFPVVFYLDRLDRNPVKWGFFPRLQVWDMKLIESVCAEDQSPKGRVNKLYWDGDYGQLGTLDIAYGERHPREARDTAGPVGGSQTLDVAYGEKHPRDARDTSGPAEGSQTLDVAYGERHPQEARDTTGPGSQTLDVAYGERHPWEARDTVEPVGGSQTGDVAYGEMHPHEARDTAGPVTGSETLDVAYGERHPREARDTSGPAEGSQTLDVAYGERYSQEASDTAESVRGSQTLDVAYGQRHPRQARDIAGPVGGSQTLDVAYGERHPREARGTGGVVRGSQTLDVAYGERHPRDSRDTAGPVGGSQVMLDDVMNITPEKANKEKVVSIMGVKINCPPDQNARDTAGTVGGSQTLGAAYGERHPQEARDTTGPFGGSQVMLNDVMKINFEKANKEKGVYIMGVKINCPPDQNS